MVIAPFPTLSVLNMMALSLYTDQNLIGRTTGTDVWQSEAAAHTAVSRAADFHPHAALRADTRRASQLPRFPVRFSGSLTLKSCFMTQLSACCGQGTAHECYCAEVSVRGE